MSVWWGRLLEPAEIIPILSSRLGLRRVEEEISVSVYCDPMKQAVGVLMSCLLIETEIAPLCFGGIWIVFATDTRLIPDSMSSV